MVWHVCKHFLEHQNTLLWIHLECWLNRRVSWLQNFNLLSELRLVDLLCVRSPFVLNFNVGLEESFAPVCVLVDLPVGQKAESAHGGDFGRVEKVLHIYF
jgi:hypothetical protein